MFFRLYFFIYRLDKRFIQTIKIPYRYNLIFALSDFGLSYGLTVVKGTLLHCQTGNISPLTSCFQNKVARGFKTVSVNMKKRYIPVARKMVLTGTRLDFNFFDPVLLSRRKTDLI